MKKIDCEFCSLRAQPDVICHLAGGALADFRALSTPGLYKPRQVIFSEGGSAGGLYLVCNGAVKLYNSDRFGRDHILEIAGPGSLLGELPVDPSQGLSTSAETICESQLCFLSREGVERLIELHPETALRLIAALSSELALARRKVRDLALKGAEGRLASLLLQLASGQPWPGDRLLLRYRRSEIAEMIGVSTETAIRLFGKLRQKHLIAAEGKEILILDRERLGKVASYDQTET